VCRRLRGWAPGFLGVQAALEWGLPTQSGGEQVGSVVWCIRVARGPAVCCGPASNVLGTRVSLHAGSFMSAHVTPRVLQSQGSHTPHQMEKALSADLGCMVLLLLCLQIIVATELLEGTEVGDGYGGELGGPIAMRRLQRWVSH
jgi:hypothetical protein